MGLDDAKARVWALATGTARQALPGETRTYTVLDRRDRKLRVAPTPIVVTVSAACPVCGAARGEPTELTVWDVCSGTEHPMSMWRNPCKHLDLHDDVIEEAEQFTLGRTG